MILGKRCGMFMVALATVFTISASQVSADAVVAWGYNNNGQLGNGTTTDSNVPVPVSDLGDDVTAVTMNYQHSLAIKNGTVWAWGYNGSGQLGNGTTTNSSVPVQVSSLTSGITAVASGDDHSLAIQNGSVWAWGMNYYSQLGDGTTVFQRNVPVQVSGLTSSMTAIAGGGEHSLAIQNGGLWAWGNNGYGQLGDGTTTNRNVPVQVSGLTNGVTVVAGGYMHSLAIQNGAVWAWGRNNYGQLGNGTTSGYSANKIPAQVSGLTSSVTAIAGGMYHSLAVKEDSTVWAWGYNLYGQLGDGTTTQRNAPVQVSGLANIVAIAAGDYSSYALSADGSIWSWGYNTYGQLGIGVTGGSYSTPQHVLPPAGYKFTSIGTSCGGYHVLATVAPKPSCAGHPADFNSDCKVDDIDIAFLLNCVTGPEGPVSGSCQAADLNSDNAIDMADFAILQRCLAPDPALLNLDCLN